MQSQTLSQFGRQRYIPCTRRGLEPPLASGRRLLWIRQARRLPARLEGTRYFDDALGQVQVSPLQCERLAQTQSSEHQGLEQDPEVLHSHEPLRLGSSRTPTTNLRCATVQCGERLAHRQPFTLLQNPLPALGLLLPYHLGSLH